jgi:toxin ParE1/3/4
VNLKYTERAKTDIGLAFEWYEDQRNGLGFEFLDCVENTLQNIILTPELYAKQYADFRRILIRRFPFSIFYTIEKNHLIIIHAVFDNRQDPKKLP